MLQHVETDSGCDIDLQGFHLVVAKLKNFFALCADHVIVMVTEMEVFVANRAVIKSVFAGKAETAHQVQGVLDKVARKLIAVFLQEPRHLDIGHMLFGFEKGIQDLKTVFEAVDTLLLKKLFELFFFLLVNLLNHFGAYR
jgi:hypothetical protein